MLSILFICQTIILIWVIKEWYLVNRDLGYAGEALNEAHMAIIVQNANLEVADELIDQQMQQNKVLSRRLDMRVVK